MQHLIKIPALVVILAAAFCSHEACAATKFNNARVSQIVKDVKTVDSAKGARPAIVNETISGGTALKTGVQSRSELVFPDNTVTRLGANTVFSFQTGTRDMHLEQGTMLLQVPKNAGGAKITTAAVTAAITGTTVMWEEPNKFICLEGTARLYLPGKPFESILVHAGEMVILPDPITSLKDVKPVKVNVKRIVQTSALFRRLVIDPRITPFTLALIDQTIDQFDRLFSDGELIQTNFVIDGSGTDIILTRDFRVNADNTLSFSDPKYGPPATFAGDFVVDDSTVILTDPTITTGMESHQGKIYRSAADDGSLAAFLGNSSSPVFDTQIDSLLQDFAPIAVFKFDTLELTNDLPVTVDTGNGAGPENVLLAAVHDVTFAGNFNDDEEAPVDFGLQPITILSLQGSIDSVESSHVTGDNLLLMAAVDINVAQGSLFAINSATAGRDINIENNSQLETFGLGPLADRDINLADAAYLVADGSGSATALRDFNLGEGSYVILNPDDPDTAGEVFAARNITIGNFSEIVRQVDASGNGRTLNVTAGGDINVMSNAVVTTDGYGNVGEGGSLVTGDGGVVDMESTAGSISVDGGTVQASGVNNGGTVRMHSGKTDGESIRITNSAQILALLNGNSEGATGGMVEISSVGGQIVVSGSNTSVRADNGTVDIHSNGDSGSVDIDGAYLAADVVKAGALGANGVLTVRAGSQIDANTTLNLYGGSSNGSVIFTGEGDIALNGNQINIAGYTVRVDQGTTVHNNGTTDIYAVQHQYNTPSINAGSFGSFTNDVTQHNSPASAPPF